MSTNLFSPKGLEQLREFAKSKVLLAFDFDGTLAPIVAEPEQAGLRDRTRSLLEKLCAYYPVIVISGRAQADVLKKLRGLELRGVIGNHGIEPWAVSDKLLETVARWHPVLEEHLAGLEGVFVEDKLLSVAVHYRAALDKARVQKALHEAIEKLSGVRVLPGLEAVNLLPEGAPNKALALAREQQRLGCSCAIYVGDEPTDEEVFRSAGSETLLSIRVGRAEGSAASLWLENQESVDALLSALLELRQAPA